MNVSTFSGPPPVAGTLGGRLPPVPPLDASATDAACPRCGLQFWSARGVSCVVVGCPSRDIIPHA